MSDFFTTSQDAYRTACIATFVTLVTAGHGLVERVKNEDRGQTAAEYMGVLLLVGAIITIVVTSGVGKHIRDAIVGAVDNISEQKPNCKKVDC
jgi:hypothetical protein